MRAKLQEDPILTRFRTAVGEAYGDRLERVVLYGSRARGDHRPDSDYDIAVFIKDPGTLWDEAGRLAEVEDEILRESGAVINAMPFPGSRLPRAYRLHVGSTPRWARSMRTETRDFLAKARECLAAAKTILAISLPGVAAKEGYLAAYHTAHAFVFERTGKAVKTHSGLRTAYARAAREEPRLDPAFSRSLSRAYKFKEVADYGISPTIEVTMADAREVIENAERFIDTVADLLRSKPE